MAAGKLPSRNAPVVQLGPRDEADSLRALADLLTKERSTTDCRGSASARAGDGSESRDGGVPKDER